MNEAETRAELIDPALKAAGWGETPGSRVRREEVISQGRLEGAGRRSAPDIADYVLIYKEQKLAVIEAKRRGLPATEGLAQAKRYAQRLQARFAYATNGDVIHRVDMGSGSEGPVASFAGPQDLWDEVFAATNAWRERFGEVPFADNGGSWQMRYYQHNAITNVHEAIAKGRKRILLTMATGTGKTAAAFQVAWKLFQSRWNASGAPTRRPRILFLADRNILADQAYNSFAAFGDDARVRIDPDIIRKRGRVPKNGHVFFTIFQTFMCGRDAEGNPSPSFGDYPKDFFDFIVIDECHRGGANDESTWRGILEYFAPAVQLGMTATPRRDENANTYAWFGEPVYVYSLKEGINDGFLTPFRVRQIATTIDEYVYTPDDQVIEGEVEVGRRYTEEDFNRVIKIEARERYRVQLLLSMIDQSQKTLVFCATQEHALAVRDLINQMKQSPDPNYCVRVTANDGPEGERFLRLFQDNEKTIPTVLTTSQKLSTGVDARNVRNIVLLRPIRSMIEFKQIIGRGTRLFEGKDYFTIQDFVQAHKHFSDPDWDGDPLPEPCPTCGQTPCICKTERQPCMICGHDPCSCKKEPAEPCAVCGASPCVCPNKTKVVIKLADGKERALQHMTATTFWGPDGQPISAAQFIARLYGELPSFFRNEDELRRIWGDPATRAALLQGLAGKGYGTRALMEVTRLVEAEQSDLFDVLAYIAFAKAPISRQARVETHSSQILSRFDQRQWAFLQFVLDQYIQQGVEELDPKKLPHLLELRYNTYHDALAEMGGDAAHIRTVFAGFQRYLYS